MREKISNEKGSSMIEIIVVLTTILILFTFIFKAVIPGEKTITNVDTGVTAIQAEHVEVLQTFFLGAAIVIGTLVILGGTIFGVIYLMEQSKKRDKEKNMVEIMKDINRKGIKTYFKLEDKKLHQATYTFQKNNYLFEVGKNGTLISCKVTKEGKKKTLLNFVFDHNTQTFTTQNITKGQIKDEKKDYKIIEMFIQKIIHHHWHTEIHFNITKEEDMDKSIKEIEAVLPKIENHTLKKELIKLKEQMDEKGEQKMSERIERMMNTFDLLYPHLDKMDLEVNHIVHNSIIHDLNRLLSLYEDLEEEEKATYHEKVEQGIEKIENKIEAIYEKAQDKKELEIEKMLVVIENRYAEKQA